MDAILGVKIDNLEKEEVFQKVEAFLDDNKFHQIATINPEFILEAQKNAEFRNVITNCDLNVADGTGIRFAFYRFGKKLKARITGIDLMLRILKMANRKGINVFLVANQNGLSSWEETADAIKEIYPNLSVSGMNMSPDFMMVEPLQKNVIVFCNFGAPYQEVFLNSLKNDIIGLAMGVGGSFDYLTGKLKRAPKWMRIFGLEWLWRLILQPQRWKRIWNAVVIFPIKILFNKK
jgi:N-acetylglucosaminyldiphosphoundecaprenol N-acetyl-beta-D-mannosaminyltransferase